VGLYLPLWEATRTHFCIVRLAADESVVLNSRERVPYIVYFELIEGSESCASEELHRVASSYTNIMQEIRRSQEERAISSPILASGKDSPLRPDTPVSAVAAAAAAVAVAAAVADASTTTTITTATAPSVATTIDDDDAIAAASIADAAAEAMAAAACPTTTSSTTTTPTATPPPAAAPAPPALEDSTGAIAVPARVESPTLATFLTSLEHLELPPNQKPTPIGGKSMSTQVSTRMFIVLIALAWLCRITIWRTVLEPQGAYSISITIWPFVNLELGIGDCQVR
jgi:hypothetical protein